MKRHVTLLYVHHGFVHGLILLQRSSLPLMLILLANDVEVNPGPVNSSEQFEQCSRTSKNGTIPKSMIPKTSFRFLSWNTRSLFSLHKTTDGEVISNHSSLQDFIHSESIDMVCLTETWLSEKHFNVEILPEDYNVFRVDRICKTGGGVLIVTRESSFPETKQVYFSQTAELEIVCIECTTNSSRILVVCCYRPPNSCSEWLLSFNEFLNYVSDLYKKIIITGDFNFPRISWSENVVTATGESERFFHNILSDHFLNQLIDIPTRENTVLDLIITNIPVNINNIEVIDPNNFTMFSDHKCVLFVYQDSVTASHKLKRSVYDYNRADFEACNRLGV